MKLLMIISCYISISNKSTNFMNDSFVSINQNTEIDSINSYFDCITECSIIDGHQECITRCVEIHLKGENQNE